MTCQCYVTWDYVVLFKNKIVRWSENCHSFCSILVEISSFGGLFMQKLGQRGKLKGNWVIQQTGICWQGKSHKISRAMVSMWKRNMTLRCDPSKKYLTDIKPSNGGARKRISGAKFQEVFFVLFLSFSIQTIQYSCLFSMSLSECVRRERLDLLDPSGINRNYRSH